MSGVQLPLMKTGFGIEHWPKSGQIDEVQ